MKVFISWSGDCGKVVAEALREWLPMVIQALDPEISTRIAKGVAWDRALEEKLDESAFGLACITRDSRDSRWLHYEAGILASGGRGLWTVLFDLDHTDVEYPLARFNHTRVRDKDDVFRLVEAINDSLETAADARPLPAVVLQRAFERSWPELVDVLEQIEDLAHGPAQEPLRDERALLEEILTSVRELPLAMVAGGANRPGRGWISKLELYIGEYTSAHFPDLVEGRDFDIAIRPVGNGIADVKVIMPDSATPVVIVRRPIPSSEDDFSVIARDVDHALCKQIRDRQ